MFNSILLIVFGILGIGVAIVYNKFVLKDYPDYKKKPAYFFTVVIFLSFSLLVYVVVSVDSYAKSAINNYSVKMEQYIKDSYPDNEFVRDGLDLKGINNDISQVNTTVLELKSILPTYDELGVNKMVYDLIVDYAINELQKRLGVINSSANLINTFADQNNVLTVSSVTNGFKNNAVKLINTISLIIAAVFLVVVLVYIIYTLTVVNRERKFKKIAGHEAGGYT